MNENSQDTSMPSNEDIKILTLMRDSYTPSNGPMSALKAKALDAAICALLASYRAPAVASEEQCPHCDDTGDVHSVDGEWRGTCHCPSGKAVAAQSSAQSADAPKGEPVCKGSMALGSGCGTCARCRAELAAPPETSSVRDAEVTPEMLKAAQMKSELGGWCCSNWAGAYDCIAELYRVMAAARQEKGK